MIVSIVKKGIIVRNHPWQERKDIIFRVKFGISPIGVINENFCSNSRKIVVVGSSGFMKQGSDII
jgi:hypothetical protein